MQGLLQQLQATKTHPLYDQAPVGLCIIDTGNAAFSRLYANPKFSGMFPAQLPEEVEKALRQKSDITALDLQLAGTDVQGSSWGRLTLTHMPLEGRQVALLWLEDISEAKRIAQEAIVMADMKSAFLASMSHEIRTPMQSVYGLLELVHDEPIPAETREMVATARKSASGLLEILDDILDLAKVEAGKVELDNFEIPLRTLAYGVMECMEVKLFNKPVKMLTDIEQGLPFVIMGDPTRMRQIMLNFVSNAMKFTEKGSITLRISTKVQHIPAPQEGLALRFEVEDTGIGMPLHVCQKLFKAFVQADNSTTRKYGGTGLGLSICQKLIELMGGKIGVTSVVGKGSIFWFEIPTVVANEQTKVDLPNLDGLAVISVEDHPKAAKEILSSLTSMGAKVESVPTYKEGLDLIRKRPFDVAVIDQGLPDGLGIDLLKEAAKLRPFMGLILYTVRNDLGMQYTAKVIGAKFLSKPASRLGLGEAVKAAAKQIAAQDYTGPRRLLIAEDTEAVRDVLGRQLSKLGVEADFVGNGLEALKALQKKEHGILFTDLHMPEMDGYQLVAEIRAQEEKDSVDMHARFPVVAITADVQLTQRQAYLAYGFDECLLKPVSLGQFRQLLIRWGVLRETAETMAPLAAEEALVAAILSSTSLPPAVDRKAMIAQMGAVDAGTIEMLGMFVKMTAPVFEKIDAAFAQGNTHSLKELAHSLKGSARSACCPHLGTLAAEMQENAEKGLPVTAEAIAALKAEFARVTDEIKNMKP